MSELGYLRNRIERALDETVDMPLSSRLACADAVIAALASVQDGDVSVSTAEGERIARAIWGYLPESCRGHEWCDLCSSEKEYIKIARGYVTPWERIEEDR